MKGRGPSMVAVDNCVCTIFKARDAKYPLRFAEAKMPIRAVIKDAGAFTPEEAEVLISAFESTLQKIGLAKREDQLSLVIAKKIIAIATSGEIDPEWPNYLSEVPIYPTVELNRI